jgi:quercetin dioxygenase-like cupin family protein
MPEIRFVHFSEVEPWSVLPQLHGERRASVHLHVVEQSDDRFVSYTRYDPDYVVEAHRHKGDQLIHVLEGEMNVGGHACPRGTTIILPKGAVLGPIIAGPEGTHILEVFLGKDANHPEPVDVEETRDLFESRGIEPLFNVHGPRTSEKPD